MSTVPKLTKEQAAIIGAFTGIACGPFSDIQGYAEQKLGRPIWTHEFADKTVVAELKAASKSDFIALCYVEPRPEFEGNPDSQEDVREFLRANPDREASDGGRLG